MGRINLLKELLKDEFYNFDYKYALTYLESLIKDEKGILYNMKRASYANYYFN